MDKYMKFSDLLEYLRSRNDEARKCGHEETYFDLLTIIDGLKNMETIPASAFDKDIDVPIKWIPVSEKLPEEKINPNTQDFEEVLCSTTFGDVRAYKFGTPLGWKEPHFWYGPGKMDEYVLAWMPLPEPYKEK